MNTFGRNIIHSIQLGAECMASVAYFDQRLPDLNNSVVVIYALFYVLLKTCLHSAK